jgi:protein MYSM1
MIYVYKENDGEFFFSSHAGMRIHQAFPCRSLNTGQNDVNVEMDPTSAIEKRQEIEERNMQVVGWYHSHPTFVPDPSLVDIENQRNYQMLCRDHHVSNTMLEPFVGAIVGPYDQALPASASAINWFHVGGSNSDRPVPKRLFYELKESENLTQDEMDRMVK